MQYANRPSKQTGFYSPILDAAFESLEPAIIGLLSPNVNPVNERMALTNAPQLGGAPRARHPHTPFLSIMAVRGSHAPPCNLG
jgi:hypothetical protein